MTGSSTDQQIAEDIVKAHEDPQETLHPGNPGGMKVIGSLLVAAVLGGVGYGICVRHSHERALIQISKEEAAQSVSVTHAVAESKDGDLTIPGTVTAFIETPIFSRTNGYLRKWYFDIGSHVRRGELLALVEAPEVDQQLMQAEAELGKQEANAELARTTSERWRALVIKHAVSQQETDQTVSNYIAAQAAVNASQADVKRLEQLQNYERIVSPFDGVITARNTDIGDLINAGSALTNPKELFHLADTSVMRVFASIPDAYADRVHNGGQVKITQGSNLQREFQGRIVRNADAIDLQSRTLNVEIDIPNPDGALRPGAYVFAHFDLPGTLGAMILPTNALLFRAEGTQAAVVRSGRITLVPVRIGHDDGDSVEVLSGINSEDEVVLNPSDALMNGAQVRVANVVSPKEEK
jgi:RND family efflux transporter MFP subunit